MDEPQIDDKGPQVRTERRAGRHVGRRFGPERLAAAGAEPAIQRHPRDVRLDQGKLDVVVGVERGLRDARQVGPAMSAMIGQDVALARRIGMQGTVRSGMRCASARAPARRRRVGRRLPALRGRRAGIVRRLRWQLQLLTQRRVLRPQRSVICLQAGQPRRQHLHLPVQRGEGFLVERIKGLTIHPILESAPAGLVKAAPQSASNHQSRDRAEQLRRGYWRSWHHENRDSVKTKHVEPLDYLAPQIRTRARKPSICSVFQHYQTSNPRSWVRRQLRGATAAGRRLHASAKLRRRVAGKLRLGGGRNGVGSAIMTCQGESTEPGEIALRADLRLEPRD